VKNSTYRLLAAGVGENSAGKVTWLLAMVVRAVVIARSPSSCSYE
jgi:hypothetical protein